MKYLISQSTDPFFNLATEEYLIQNLQEDIFYVYQNRPCVVIGKNQNPQTEVGLSYLKENDIWLVRRLSGGGAVYQDMGNFNYSFVLKDKASDLYNFKKYSQPIIDALKQFDFNVYFSGRNDLLIDECKISGSAQFVDGNNLIHHGTLLVNADFSNVKNILLPHNKKLKTKGVKSVQSRVGNLVDFISKPLEVKTLMKELTSIIGDDVFTLSEKQEEAIWKIANKRKTAVNFLITKKGQYDKSLYEYFPGFGAIEVHLNFDEDKIKEIAIFGEYFSKTPFSELEKQIKGVTYNYDGVKKFVESIPNFKDFFYNLKKEDLVKLILQKESEKR